MLKYTFPDMAKFISVKTSDNPPKTSKGSFIGLYKLKKQDPTLLKGFNPQYNIANSIRQKYTHKTPKKNPEHFLNEFEDTIGLYKESVDNYYVFIKKNFDSSLKKEKYIERWCGRVVYEFCKLNSLLPEEKEIDKKAPVLVDSPSGVKYGNPVLAVPQYHTFLNETIEINGKYVFLQNAQYVTPKTPKDFIQYNSEGINVYESNESMIFPVHGVFQTFISRPGYKSSSKKGFNSKVYDLVKLPKSFTKTPFKFSKGHPKIESLSFIKITEKPHLKLTKYWEHVVEFNKDEEENV